MCEAAIGYGDSGWPVIPLYSVGKDGNCQCGNKACKSPGKHPHSRYAPSGSKNATTDGSIIARWFSGEDINIGIVAGLESHLVILDVDPAHGGEDSLKQFGEMPQTPKVQTGSGGFHFYFRHPGTDVRNSAGTIAPGLDVRGHHGYVVAPPSLHASGREYKWLIDATAPLADMPKWLLNGNRKKTAVATPESTEKVAEGQRNNAMTVLAGKLRRHGLHTKAIFAALMYENELRCKPPLLEAELKAIADSITKYAPGDVPIDVAPVLLDLDTVETEEVTWFWENRIPQGMFSLIAGNPDCGKSFLTTWMAAHVTTGKTWPDTDQMAEEGKVIFLPAEDSVRKTIKPRIEWQGGDVTKVRILSGVTTNEREGRQQFFLDQHMPALEKAIKETDELRLVVIDPVSGFFGNTDSHKQVAVVSTLAPLADLAERYDIAIIAVAHLNKSINAAAVYRVLGSMGFVTSPRAVWLVGLDKKDETKKRRLLVPCKCNLSIYPTTLAFLIEADKTTKAGKIVFDPTPLNTSADDLLASGNTVDEDDESTLAEAKKWLLDALDDGAWIWHRDILGMAKDQGIAKRTIERAKGELGVPSVKLGKREKQKWYWTLDREKGDKPILA